MAASSIFGGGETRRLMCALMCYTSAYGGILEFGHGDMNRSFMCGTGTCYTCMCVFLW